MLRRLSCKPILLKRTIILQSISKLQSRSMASTSTSNQESLLAAITAQGNLVRSLKAEKADSNLISEAIAKLQALKLQDGIVTSTSGGKPKKAAKFTLKTPKVRLNVFEANYIQMLIYVISGREQKIGILKIWH